MYVRHNEVLYHQTAVRSASVGPISLISGWVGNWLATQQASSISRSPVYPPTHFRDTLLEQMCLTVETYDTVDDVGAHTTFTRLLLILSSTVRAKY